jgi:glucosamine--fructose-6-phosphate aminotransferase (isomerizing)
MMAAPSPKSPDTNPYIADIHSQPDTLRAALEAYRSPRINDLSLAVREGRFERIVITGMGASYFGTYPAWLQLVQHGLPVWWVDTSELLHPATGRLAGRTLFWVVSQSGFSIEIQRILEKAAAHRRDGSIAYLLAVTNDPESPLARQADHTMLLNSGEEFTVGTRSYVNTLAVLQLAVTEMTRGDFSMAWDDLQRTAQAVQGYLGDWEMHVKDMIDRVGIPERLVVLGRGPSLATAWLGALIQKEAAKFQVEGMSAAQFRHGPLELTDPRLTAIIVAGDPNSWALNRSLALDLRRYGAGVFWEGAHPDPELENLRAPDAPPAGMRIAEVLPFQALTVALARQTGVEPGIFRYIGKVTLEE